MINFLKNPKKPILGRFWVFFPQIWAKMNFPGKKAQSFFKYSSYLHAKNQKCQTDGRTGRHTMVIL